MNTVIRVANLAVRAALLVIVAFITFKHPWPGAWKGAVAVAAVTAATVQLVLWAHADLAAPARLRYAFLLPYALAAVTVTCDMAAAGPIGGELMVLAVLAALMAGSDTSLAAGLIVVGAGKHAPHQPVGIRLDYAGAHTSLAVTNHLGEDALGGHGPGLATVNGGYGLAGMRERLLLVKGTLSAGQNGSDWVVMAKVPR